MFKVTSKGSAPAQATPLDRLSPRQLIDRDFSTAVIAFHEAIAAQLEMSAAEWKSLGALEQHAPLTAGRLAELSGFTTGAITGIVDRLERAGYVRRERHPSDRRSIIIHPLRLRGIKARVAPIFGSLARRMAEISAGYTPAQLAAIYKFFAQTTDVLRGEIAKLQVQEGRPARKRTGKTRKPSTQP